MKTDLQLDVNLELVEDATTLDLLEGPADEQHQQLLLITKKGAWKENPQTGVGLQNYLLDDDMDGLLREVRSQFEADGQKVERVGFDKEELKLLFDAEYTS